MDGLSAPLTLAAIKERDLTEGVLLVPHPPNCPCVWHDRRHLLGLVEGLLKEREQMQCETCGLIGGRHTVVAHISRPVPAALAALAAGQEERRTS